MKSLLTKYRALIFLCALLNLPACLLHAQRKKFAEIKAAMEEKFSNERAVEEDEEQEDDDDNAKYRRWEWWAEQHLDGRGYVVNDVSGNFKIYEQSKHDTSLLTNRSLSIGGSWIELLHSPYGSSVNQMGKGRIDCIAEIPGTANVLAGTSGGGIWRGTRANTSQPFSWTALSDGIARLSITDICINPNNPNEIYIATGSGDDNSLQTGTGYTSFSSVSRSLGVLKSTDGGINWARTSLFFESSDQTIIYRMIMDPTNPQIMFVATNGGLYRTQNGWNTNTQLMTGVITDIKLKTDNHLVLFVADGPGNVFRLTDNGSAVFSSQTVFSFPGTPARIVLAVAASNASYLYVLGAANTTGFTGLYKCTDAGVANPSFNLQSSSPDILSYNATGSGGANKQVFYDLVLIVHPQNAERIFAGGLNLWESTNGGTSWTVRSDWTTIQTDSKHCHSDFHQLKFNSQNNLYNCNDGGLFTMDLSNNSWTYNSIGVNNTQYYRISITNQTSGSYNGRLILGGTQDNGTLVWRSSGLTKAKPADGMDNAMASDDGLYQVATSQNGSLSVSVNGGLSFTSPSTAPAENGNGAWVTPIVQHCSVPDYVYAGYKNIYFSDNDPDNWSNVINTNFPNPIRAMCQGNYSTAGFPGTNVLYCAVDINTNPNGPSNYHLYRIENNLLSTKTDLWNFSNTITSVKCDPNNARNVYVTLGGFGDDHKVYYSSDRGQSWTNISGAAGANGSLPDLPANCIALKDGGANGIYVGTDIGVYFRQNVNAGEKWRLFSNGLPNVPVTDLEIDPATNEIFAATYGRGLWKSDLHENCLAVLNISGNTTGATYYEANNTINSSTYTAGGYGNKITLNAGQEINLSDGYTVLSGSAMWAYIQGCDNPRNDPVFDKNKAKKRSKKTVKHKPWYRKAKKKK